MDSKKGIRITIDLHYPLVEALMELAHYNNVDDVVAYIDNMLSSAVDMTIHGARIRGTEKAQEYTVETFDDSEFQLEYDYISDEE